MYSSGHAWDRSRWLICRYRQQSGWQHGDARMVRTKSRSLTQVWRLIASVNHKKPNTVRQRLKQWSE